MAINETMLTYSIVYFTSLVGLFQRCHSFKQVKRRFKPPNFMSRHSITQLHEYYYISARGGDISDDYGIDETFSNFVESFESELAEIRREVEIEAEIEMQKLLGLVDGRKNRDEDDDEGETEVVEIDSDEEQPGGQEVVDGQQNESEGLDKETGFIGGFDNGEVFFDDGSIDERGLESDINGNEQEAIESFSPAEEGTYDLDERFNEDMGAVTSEEDQHLTTGEDLSQHLSETKPPQSADANNDISEIKLVTNVKPKKRKSKSKKTRTSKTKKSEINVESLTPEHEDCYHVRRHELSNVSNTIQKDIETTKSRLQFYLQSDLVRALFLFIATVAVSIWLQRLQKQMEAAGI